MNHDHRVPDLVRGGDRLAVVSDAREGAAYNGGTAVVSGE
jgi:hypothetical protein